MVAADNEEVLPLEILLGILDTAGSPELALLVDIGDLGPKERAVPECFLDGTPHVAEGEHYFPEPEVREVCDEVLDGWAVDDGDTGLGPFECEGAEPGAFPPAHDTHLHATVFVPGWFKDTVFQGPVASSGFI